MHHPDDLESRDERDEGDPVAWNERDKVVPGLDEGHAGEVDRQERPDQAASRIGMASGTQSVEEDRVR